MPPVAFAGLTKALGRYGLSQGARVVYEKPFGTSGEGFRELDRVVHSVLDDQQVYRIDHFLGKEATQDLHVLRLFTRPDGLAAVWDVAEPLLSGPPRVNPYPPGSGGPAQARDLVAPGHWLLG